LNEVLLVLTEVGVIFNAYFSMAMVFPNKTFTDEEYLKLLTLWFDRINFDYST